MTEGGDPSFVRADQIRCLSLAAVGLATPEIAARTGWPVERVRSALTQAIVALGARSKLEAVLIALRTGLIDPAADGCGPPERS